MPTLRDVAVLAGGSVATVSNVVNEARPVSPATRARVEEALARRNYAPARGPAADPDGPHETAAADGALAPTPETHAAAAPCGAGLGGALEVAAERFLTSGFYV